MSVGYWRAYAAIVGLTLGVCVISVASPWITSIVHRYANSIGERQGASEQKQQAQKSQSEDGTERPIAAGKQSLCDDICAQRRMADAAERQIWLSLLGVVLVGGSLFFTAWASIAAGQAAAAAKESVALTQDTATRQLRAYVTLTGGGAELVNIRDQGFGLRVQITLRNSGQTPAYEFTTWIGQPVIKETGDLPFTDPTPLAERNGSSITGPGAEAHLVQVISVSEAELAALRMRTLRLFVWGGADYTDVFGQRRFFKFRCVNGAEIVPPQGQGWSIGPHRLGYQASEQPET
jgi:hypothetical protein